MRVGRHNYKEER